MRSHNVPSSRPPFTTDSHDHLNSFRNMQSVMMSLHIPLMCHVSRQQHFRDAFQICQFISAERQIRCRVTSEWMLVIRARFSETEDYSRLTFLFSISPIDRFTLPIASKIRQFISHGMTHLCMTHTKCSLNRIPFQPENHLQLQLSETIRLTTELRPTIFRWSNSTMRCECKMPANDLPIDAERSKN